MWSRSSETCVNKLSLSFILIFTALGCNALPRYETADETNDFEENYAVEYGAPLISPLKPSIILEVNTDYILRCEANEPIIWKLPADELKNETISFQPLDDTRSYGSELRLFNVSHHNVGNYFCVKTAHAPSPHEEYNLIDLVNEYKASSIYIYVNDSEHLLADESMQVIDAYQYQNVDIPCRPTMPDIEVLLVTPNETTYSSTTTGRYDPKRGFVIVLRAMTEAGIFRCMPKVPSPTNEFESQDIFVEFIGKVPYINKPQITSTSRGHVYENQSFELLCEVKVDDDVMFDAKWVTPKTVDPNRVIKHSAIRLGGGLSRANLTLIDAKVTDSGLYKCVVTDHSKNTAHNFYTMTVLRANESYINITEPNNYYNIADRANKKILINVKYRGYPWPTLRWFKPDGSEITPTHKFEINTTDTSTTLEIKNAQMIDSGEYTVEATNGNVRKKLNFNVSVSDVPVATVQDVYVQAGEETDIVCKVLSFPPPKVQWTFTSCQIKPRWPVCLEKHDLELNSSRVEKGGRSIEYTHRLYFTPPTPGVIRCVAQNSIGNSTGGLGHVLIGDISDNMTVYGVDENKKIARGDEVIISCAALAYFYTDDLDWYKDGIMVQPNDDIEITTSQSEYSYKKTIRFKSISDSDRGSYECRAWPVRDHEPKESKFIDIFVHEPSAPAMIQTNLDPNTELELKLGGPLELECKAVGIPRANVLWYKDGVKLNAMEKENIDIVEENAKLIIQHMMPGDEGVYKCIASNRLGEIESSVSVQIVDLPGIGLGWIMSILVFIALLLGLVVYLCVRVHRERQLLRELKAAGLENFEEGAMEHINPALSLDEQADLLPYDRNFEFPREKLKLGKQLGAGAFGVVLKAHAEGIKPDEKETVVAVKMVKRTADNEVMRALVSELKIMIHLGQHLNVVNLLGAVTKNIVKKELMVIVEFCRYGNVQNVLMKNRKHFINQINPETDKIDPTITCSRFSDSFESNRHGLKYVNLTFTKHQYINEMKNTMNNNYTITNHSNSEGDPRTGTRAGRPNSSSYLRRSDLYEGQVDSCHTVMTTVPGDDENVMSNNSVQPAWRSNYKPDSNEAMSVSTSDLISWAFQVARGMDYLSSKRVLHGDLAARNILLCEDNVVKICDFGLARTMYNSNNYKKQGEAPLPIKWLALESLSDHVFSTYTDVWSFGIVLWEFFSLAKVPYTGMDANQNLYLKLKDGYRMEKPPYANDDLYDIMLECWSANPESRPLFTDLEKRFARMLGDEVTNHYMDLNEPYLRSNIDFKGLSQIYLPQPLGSPDELAPPPPRYVNGRILPEIRIESSSDDYLNMHADSDTVIFSPTRPNEYEYEMPTTKSNMTSFTFPEPPTTNEQSPTLANNLDGPNNAKNLEKEDLEPEEIPMLHNDNMRDNHEDYEDNPKHKMQKGMPKPSPRHYIKETKLNGDANYMNIKISPQKTIYNNNNNNNNSSNNTNGRTAHDAFSNPGYQVLKTFEK